MGSIFELIFPDVDFSVDGDTQVLCPFPHSHPSGYSYYEDSPSMSINISKGIFHCFGCGKKGNDFTFLSEYMGLPAEKTITLKNILDETGETFLDWKPSIDLLHNNSGVIEEIKTYLHFSDKVIKKLNLGIEGLGKGIGFPVFIFGKLVDVISYNQKATPKYKKRTNSKNGMIMPYDTWRYNKKPTFIVAGQKDLGIALTKGMNAITITGGEGTVPELFLNDFKDREVYIIYDNDDAGNKGAKRVAMALKPYAKNIKVVDLAPVCTEKGEDLWDFFVKYEKTIKDLAQIIKQTSDFSDEDYEKAKEAIYPTVSLSKAITQEYLNKTLRSNIQVVAVHEEKFLVPTSITAKKKALSKQNHKNKLAVGQTATWVYNKKNPVDLFYLMDNNITDTQMYKNKKSLLRMPDEEDISIITNTEETVFKCTITDFFEKMDFERETMQEFVAYSIGHPIESGKKYKITYKLIPHPKKGNIIQMIILDVEESADAITSFKVTPNVIENLKRFQLNSTLEETIDKHVQRVKGLTQADFDDNLIKLIDLYFNTPLLCSTPKHERLRAFLDVLIVGETRTGKSMTVRSLQNVYKQGVIIPMNGHNASIAGIIGGSHKTTHGFQIRAGVIPRNHKGAVILEELVKAKEGVLQELTELRSSNYARIYRVSGELNLPALVRMLSLTNTKPSGTVPKPISSYPNGIEIVTDLIGTAEDIARYDIIGILPDKSSTYIDPDFKPMSPFSGEAYQDKINWIWSRTAEQVHVDEEIYKYIIKRANELNQEFISYIRLFGPEFWLKLMRLSIAIAAYVVSTDETFEKIVVTKEHVDYAVKTFLDFYDNDTFRFREFVKEEQKYKVFDDKDIKKLEDLWKEHSTILLHLETTSRISQNSLASVSGLDIGSFRAMLPKLVVNHFVRLSPTGEVIPTEKFRKAIKQIKRTDPYKPIRKVGLKNDK